MSAPVQTLIEESTGTGPARVYTLDPLRDGRWDAFVGQHPRGSVFHTSGWLEALRRTYGYEPFAVTTTEPGRELRNGMVLCRVRSWLTGSRLVSLPFSDHCEPLVDEPHELERLLSFLKAEVESGYGKYLEVRPLTGLNSGIPQRMRLERDEAYCFHHLDLRPSLDELYRKFHKSCVQRKIHKAEREGLQYDEGRSEELWSKFYKLMVLTRRRHQLPPQSMAWFRNLADCLGEKLKVRVVSKDGHPVASIVTIQSGRTGMYKYGCSDARYHNLGGMVLLMWRAIQDAKAAGAHWFDFGRSESDNEGLRTFKEHWGSTLSPLPYYRYPSGTGTDAKTDWILRLIHRTCSHLPDSMLQTLGGLLYRHVG